MTRFTKINFGKILIFFLEKKLFNISDTKIFIFFASNHLNVLENTIFTKECCSESLKHSQPQK